MLIMLPLPIGGSMPRDVLPPLLKPELLPRAALPLPIISLVRPTAELRPLKMLPPKLRLPLKLLKSPRKQPTQPLKRLTRKLKKPTQLPWPT